MNKKILRGFAIGLMILTMLATLDGVSVYIGQEGGGVSQDSPVIQGLNAVRADFRFYDGILKGSEAAYIFAPTAVEPGYAVKDGTSGGLKTATLEVGAYSVGYNHIAQNQNTLIVTLNGRSFYKTNNGKAYVAYLEEATYCGPVLVGETADSVAYYCEYGGENHYLNSTRSFDYNGKTYYYSSAGAWMEGRNIQDTSGQNRKRYASSLNLTEAVRTIAAQMLADFTGDTPVYDEINRVYLTLKDAIDSVPENDGAIITVLRNVEDGSEAIIPAGKTITLNVPAGKTITKTIGENNQISGRGIVNNGTLHIKGMGTIETKAVSENNVKGLIRNTGDLSLTEATIRNKGFQDNYWFGVETFSGNFVMNSGTIDCTLASGVSVAKSARPVEVRDGANFEMKGGTITTNIGYALEANGTSGNSTGSIKISGGLIEATEGVGIRVSPNLSFTSEKSIEITGGTIRSKNRNYINTSRNVSITGGTIISSASQGLTFEGTGIVQIGNSGDSSVSTTSPVIQGETYGISGDFEFYDGIIYGKPNALSQNPSKTQSGYGVAYGTSGDYQTATLSPNYTVQYYNGTSLLGSSTHIVGVAKNLTTMATLGGSDATYTTFEGWATADNSVTVTHTDGKSVSNLTSTANGTVNLYAVWSRTVNFYSGNSKTAATAKQYKNTSTYSVSAPAVGAISGWTALGWRDDTTAGEKEYGAAAAGTISGNYGPNFYATYSRPLTMAYNGNGSTGGSTASHESTTPQYYNSNGGITTITFTTAANGFTKTGYTFSKWAPNSASGTPQVAAGETQTFSPAVGATSQTITMYAQWEDRANPVVSVSDITYGQNASITITDTGSGTKYFAVTTANTAPTTTNASTTPASTGSTLNEWILMNNSTAAQIVTFTGLNAGSYYAWAKDTAGNTVSAPFTVSKATRPITMDATKSLSLGMSGTLAFTYEGEDVTLSNSNVSSSNTAVATVTMTDGSNAGTVNITTKATGNSTITVTVPESANYLETSKTCALTVTSKLARTITMNATKSVNYGSTGNTLTFTYNGEDATLGNSNVSSSNTNVATVTMTDGSNGGTVNITVKNAGTTTITVSVPETTTYASASKTCVLTVNPVKAANPTVTQYSAAYDGTAHGITVSNVIGGTVVYSENGTSGWSVNAITGTDVGEKTVYVKVSGDSNHTDSRVVSAKITITKRPITITAKDQTVTYGTAIDNSTSQVVIGGNGLVSRHTLSTITLTQSTTNATTNGTITAGAATIKDGNNQDVTGNYQITYKTGKLTINKLTATVPTATAYAGTYDGTAHGITVSNVSGGTVVYSANGTSDWSASPITRTLAGETTVYAKVLGDSNHADSAVVSAKITIAQRELTITAKDQTVNYGTAIANNTNQVILSGSGLATGDSLNAITLTQSTTSATINGTINPSNAVILNSTSANVTDSYRITYVGGALTINKVQAVAPTLTAYTGTYDEAAHGITVSGGSGGTIVYSTTGTGDWSATPITRTLPGETTVYVKVQGDSNHTDSEVKSAKITINKRTITDLIINGSNFVYTGSRITPEVTVKYGTTVLTEGTDYTLTFTNNINVGTASVTATATADGVYTGSITKTFQIKASSFDGDVKIVGQNIFGETLTVDVSSVEPEDAVLAYKWYSGDPAHGGTVIGTSNSLVIDNAGYVGANIYVVVTATKDNYETKTFTDQTDGENNGSAKVEKAERTISVDDTLDLTYGTSGTIDFTYTGDDVTATATSTNGSVVSVAMNDGVNNGSVTVTPTGAGNTTVKITIPESGGYKKVEATVTVKVNASTMSGDVKITGTNTYGETLTADTTGIRPTGATVRYQWYYSDNNATTGGIPITTGGNGASLVLNNATYVGKHIYVEVIAEKNGYTTKTYVDFADSENNGTDIVSKADRSISMSPTQNVIFGQTGTVTFTYTGSDVTATAKTTDENIATVTMADGNNRGTVTITPVKAGTTAITVTIPESATHKGITENCALTVEEATMTGTVKVTGENTYGKTLTADTSAIRPTGATFTYKWYAGTELVGTNSTYVVGENAVGKVIKLVVTASMENYDDYTVEDVTDNSNNTTATASKANGWVELAESTGTAFYGTEERSVIITRHHGGTLTASIVGTSTASVAIDTSDSQEKAKITNVNSVNAGNNIRIRVKSAETNVYKAATADFVLTITRSEMSGSISVSGTAASGETITVDASHIYPTGCELTYEWYVSHVKPDSDNSTGTGRSGLPADAVKISGASGSSYQIGTDLDDVYIYVVVKAHDPHNNYEDTEYVAGRTNSVDGAGPELGKITVLNADKTGTVNGNSVEIEIRECYDESGIASYEWQYSTDGIHWTTVKKDNLGESHSEFTHEIPEDDQSAETLYYRVIVNDIYGNSSTSGVVIVHRKDILNRKGTIRFTTTQTSNEEVVIHTVIKTTTDVVSVKVNGSAFDYSSATIDAQNREITTSFNYKALVNGNFVFEVTDKAGNVVRESISISTIAKEATDAAKITYTVKGATILSNAQIIFASNEAMKIKNPNRYTGITFDTKDYATRITATIDKGASFNAGTEFIFESRNHIDTTVEVEEAILTEVEYVRFTGQNASAKVIDTSKADALASGVSSAQVNVSGTIYSYYGFGPSKPSTSVAASTDLSAAATLGSASKTYSVGVDKQISKMESSGKASVSSASGYTNGNTTGTSSTVSSESFRLKLVP